MDQENQTDALVYEALRRGESILANGDMMAKIVEAYRENGEEWVRIATVFRQFRVLRVWTQRLGRIEA